MIPLEITDPNDTWFFSDPHFDHRNIIRYCNRPFSNVAEMNATLLSNYWRCVSRDSLVFFLGDMAFGRGSRKVPYWLERVATERFVYIKGSHDHGVHRNGIDVVQRCSFDYNGIQFYLVHDFHEAPIDWSGWIIHGHNHGNRPLRDAEHRRVNMSVEVTGYRPVSLSEILTIIERKET